MAGCRARVSKRPAVDRNKLPLIPAIRQRKCGNAPGGGAHLTLLGEEVLARYRRMQDASAQAIADDLAALKRVMRKAHD